MHLRETDIEEERERDGQTLNLVSTRSGSSAIAHFLTRTTQRLTSPLTSTVLVAEVREAPHVA